MKVFIGYPNENKLYENIDRVNLKQDFYGMRYISMVQDLHNTNGKPLVIIAYIEGALEVKVED